MSNKALSDRFFERHGSRKKPISPRRQRSIAPGAGFSSMRRGLLLGGGATVLALAGFGAMVHNERPATTVRIPQKLRIVLIDSSDRNTAVQDRLISRIIEQTALEDIAGGDRLILLGLSADQNEPLEERFNQISPERASDQSPWTTNLEQLEATWQRDFLEVYIKEARDLREVLEKRQTPFLEAIMQITSILQQYDADEKSVIIVSDALQHISGGLSAYTSEPTRSVLQMPEALAGFYNPDFGGARIKLVHILRNDARRRQGPEHLDWIESVFSMRGADLEYVGLS